MRAVLATAAAAAIGMALIPWILAWAQANRARFDPLVAVLVSVGPALGVAAGVAGLADGVFSVDERPIVALVPAVMALAAGAWTSNVVSNRAFLVAACVTGATMVFLPAPLEDPTLNRRTRGSVAVEHVLMDSDRRRFPLRGLHSRSCVRACRRLAAPVRVGSRSGGLAHHSHGRMGRGRTCGHFSRCGASGPSLGRPSRPEDRRRNVARCEARFVAHGAGSTRALESVGRREGAG